MTKHSPDAARATRAASRPRRRRRGRHDRRRQELHVGARSIDGESRLDRHLDQSRPEPHTVASDGGLFRCGALDTNDSLSFRFDQPGTYLYMCSMHPQMVGTIIVQ
jgi:hypothetical protein